MRGHWFLVGGLKTLDESAEHYFPRGSFETLCNVKARGKFRDLRLTPAQRKSRRCQKCALVAALRGEKR